MIDITPIGFENAVLEKIELKGEDVVFTFVGDKKITMQKVRKNEPIFSAEGPDRVPVSD